VRCLLVLWDIDFTLIDAGGVGTRLYRMVFRDMFGTDLPGAADMAGRTDRAIVLDTLARAGIPEPRQHLDQFLAGLAALAPAGRELAQRHSRALPGAAAALHALAAYAPGRAGFGALDRAKPGAAALDGAEARTGALSGAEARAGALDGAEARAGALDGAEARAGALDGAEARAGALDGAGQVSVVQSVLTGNVRPMAEMKLSALGLDGDLDLEVGAYGEAHEVRAELVHMARASAARKYGADFSGAATVLVGDTPLDVAAGLETGARVVAVATGGTTAAMLAESGAPTVLPDLTDTQAVLSAILASPYP